MSTPTTLAELLASLSEEERFILTMHYLRSMSSGEIAELLAVPVRAVDAVIAAGKAHLSGFIEF